MKIEQTHIDQIRQKFALLQNKQDLVSLLNDANRMLNGEKCKTIQLKSLTFYANPEICENRYRTFSISKKSGGERIIHAPVYGLKTILQSLNFVLQCIYIPNKVATGFVIGKSIVDNAKIHIGHHYVLNIDLKDFFHSFDRNRVKLGLMYEPFNLNGDKESLAFLLASLCTHPFEIEGHIQTVLPQGSPASPTLSNILCKKLDIRLNGLGKRFGVFYSRYADDITFSSLHNIYNKVEFEDELKRIIVENQKFAINPKKTRLQKEGYRQEVTGLIVNEKVNVQKRYIKHLRMWLHYWEKYGYTMANDIFKKDYFADKGYIKDLNTQLKNVIEGKLGFLKMVKGEQDSTYYKLNARYIKLVNKNSIVEKQGSDKEKWTAPEPNPKHVADFMSLFNKREGLKYLTHDYDEGSDFEIVEFLILANKVFEESTKNINIPTSLWRIVKQFAFDSKQTKWTSITEDYTSDVRQNLGWASRELLSWSKENKIHPIHNDKFKKMIFDFKRITRIESTNLEKIINASLNKALGTEIDSYEIKLKNLEKADFYSHVSFFKSALDIIFQEIKKRAAHSNNRKISISYERSISPEGYYLRVIKLTHHNSYPTKELELILHEWKEKGSMGNIIQKLKGYCHWSVETVIEENPVRVNVLKEKEDRPYDLLEYTPDGFTHILTFYYK